MSAGCTTLYEVRAIWRPKLAPTVGANSSHNRWLFNGILKMRREGTLGFPGEVCNQLVKLDNGLGQLGEGALGLSLNQPIALGAGGEFQAVQQGSGRLAWRAAKGELPACQIAAQLKQK